jgi:hypothetical protein
MYDELKWTGKEVMKYIAMRDWDRQTTGDICQGKQYSGSASKWLPAKNN